MLDQKKPAGEVIVTDWDGRDQISDTMQCVHCGAHWVVVKGSGRPHIFCHKCGGWTCSQPLCLRVCYPEEKRHGDVLKHGHLIVPD